ncbi:MAG: M15 family metallopeptidase, partial [Nocardioides sp.]
VPVLDNDTDDGVGRAEGEPPHLEVVAVRGDQRFMLEAGEVRFAAGADDEGSFTGEYDVSDGELVRTGTVTVQVTPAQQRRVTLTLAERPAALRTYALSGVATPTGRRPLVKVQERTGDRWTLVGKDRASKRGRYAVGFRTDRPTRHVFRAVAVWPDGGRERSERLRRSFRAVADVSVSGPLARRQVRWSWRPGCPVAPSGLRKIRVNHIDYAKTVSRGAIVVRAAQVPHVVKVLKAAVTAGFPIRRITPTDHFYAGGTRTPMQSDRAAMRAGNTSAFNCRPVTGNPYRVSQHSYGNAIDINTIKNPYVTGSRVYPSTSRRYLDRSTYRRGMILHDGVVARRFRALGWLWGARWSHPDYQHFSSNGG